MTQFAIMSLSGKDSAKFLQGQLTINTDKITNEWQACAIANLKGRVLFGLWIRRGGDDVFEWVISDDLVSSLQAHIKKYGAFSKITLSEPCAIYACVKDNKPTFTTDPSQADTHAWAKASVAQGNAWISAKNTELFQPQEIRLHQRGGVDYDKGCYLGQEIIARVYFKSTPKAYLHRIRSLTPLTVGQKIDKVQVVNAVDDEALVVGVPDDVAQIGEILPLPDGLNGDVSRRT